MRTPVSRTLALVLLLAAAALAISHVTWTHSGQPRSADLSG
jgi:hypothetical protein